MRGIGDRINVMVIWIHKRAWITIQYNGSAIVAGPRSGGTRQLYGTHNPYLVAWLPIVVDDALQGLHSVVSISTGAVVAASHSIEVETCRVFSLV